MKVVEFEVQGQLYALPADAVRQVQGILPVTPLPFVPAYVEGLTAIGGRVMAQIDLGVRLGLPAEPRGCATMVISVDGSEVMLRVGRTGRLLNLPETALSSAVLREDDDDPYVGEFQIDGRTVRLLRPAALGIDGLTAQDRTGAASGNLDDPSEAAAEGVAEIDIAYLVAMAGGGRFALPLDRVALVYASDDKLMQIPNAPPYVTGISVLRGTPMLVVSLSRLLGLASEGRETFMIAAWLGDMALVFQCDAAIGIRRYPESRREKANPHSKCVDSRLIDQNGAVTGLLALDDIIAGMAEAGLHDRLLQRCDDWHAAPKSSRDVAARRMLLFRVGETLCGIDIDQIRKVAPFTPPTELPGDSGLIVGMTDIGGRVLPVADIGAVFDAPLARSGAADAYVVIGNRQGRRRRDRSDEWALPVCRIEHLARIPLATIRPAAGLTNDLVREIGQAGDRLVSILSVDAVENAASLGKAVGAAA